LTLSSNVVVTAVQEASLRGQIAATTRLLELQQQLTETVRGQQTFGLRANSMRSAGIGTGPDAGHITSTAKATGTDTGRADGTPGQVARRRAEKRFNSSN